MSHFVVGVILPNTPELNPDAEIKQLLAPFDEGIEVEPYERPCYCIGDIAKDYARTEADKAFGTIVEINDRFLKDRDPEESSHDRRVAWEATIQPRFALIDKLFQEHPDRDNPNPTCGFYSGERQDWWPADKQEGDRYEDGSGCGGTGHYTSTYNPKSKWGWYSVGGRWDGVLTHTEREEMSFKTLFSEVYANPDLDRNSIRVQDLLDSSYINDVIPFAILTPEGEWVERGQMGWFGVAANEREKDAWIEQVISLLKQYPDHVIVGVDCHI